MNNLSCGLLLDYSRSNRIIVKVLMVCLGNICRSPIAHGILQNRIEQKGLAWEVDSAGTSGWHDGEMPDRRSIEVAKNYDIDISRQKSRKFVVSDFDTYDHIIAMDASNYNNIRALARDDSDKSKVSMLLNYLYPGENRQVPDPYYEGGFDVVFQMIEKSVDKMIDSISS